MMRKIQFLAQQLTGLKISKDFSNQNTEEGITYI